MKIGIISDTHGFLNDSIIEYFKGCGAIIHAGDITSQKLLDRLASIGSLYAVRGNCDRDPELQLQTQLRFQLEGLKCVAAHNCRDLPAHLENYDLAVYGHTHKFSLSKEGSTVILNPGSALLPRGGSREPTVVVLETGEGGGVLRKIEFATGKETIFPLDEL